MIKMISLAAICLVLSACGNHTQESQAPSPQIEKAADVASDTSTLPDGIKLAVPFKVRSKSDAKTAAGHVRKLVIEFKKLDAKAVDGELEKALVANGFKRYKSEATGGNLVGDYGKTGHRVTTTTTPAENSKLKLAADSAGTVYFVWH